jgi:hypothetical protein
LTFRPGLFSSRARGEWITTRLALGEAVGDAPGEGDAASSDGEGDAVGVGVATVGVSIAAGQFSRVGFFAGHWVTLKTIATVTETIPAAIAQRARR